MKAPRRAVELIEPRPQPARRHHVELSLLGLAGGEVLEFEGQLKLSLDEMRQAWEALVN